jgi:MazG family protein
MTDLDEAAKAFRDFASVVKALRTPGTGCPWDLEQDHRSLRPFLIEEAHEVLDAIDRGDDDALEEELGDLLLQVVLHAQLADDRGVFSITEVARGIAAKMVRRHPHVFGSAQVSGSAEVLKNWDAIKAAEAQAKGAGQAPGDAFDRLPESLPALLRAQRLGEKAAKMHRDWSSLADGLEQVRADFAGLEAEVRAAAAGAAAPLTARALSSEGRERLERALGDLLFGLCQLARWLGVGAEDSLRAGSRRFVDRLRSTTSPERQRRDDTSPQPANDRSQGDDGMSEARGYVLGQSASAARRLEIQDIHFAEVSEQLLDDLALRPGDRVVELGCGPGGFSRRILRRLGAGGVLVGVDASEGLLARARQALAGAGPASFVPVQADLSELGTWLDGADAVVARTVLHHVPMVEFVLGRLRARLRPGTRLGFLEPDFRTLLARLAYLEAGGRTDLGPLHTWAVAINQLYLANRISPDVGATLAGTLEAAGYRRVRASWSEGRSDGLMVENMLMFYDEVRDRLPALGILTAAQIEEQQRLLRALPPDPLPAVWGIHRVACET